MDAARIPHVANLKCIEQIGQQLDMVLVRVAEDQMIDHLLLPAIANRAHEALDP